MNDIAPATSLSDAIQATLRVQLAIDLARLQARQAQVVRTGQVWAAGQRLRRLTRAALARLQGIVEHVITPGMDEPQVHARLSEALFEILSGLADAAAADSGAGAAESYASAFGRGVRPRRTLTVSQCADAYREIKTGTAIPGPWSTDLVPHLREIQDCLSVHDPCQEVVLQKPAQSAGTECALNWITYVGVHAPAEMMMVMPTIELRDRFVKRRLRTMIRETPALSAVMGGLRSRDAEISMGVLRFPGGGLILSGANAANSLRSDAVRYVICDEVDGFEWQVGGEGDPLELIENRQRTYSRRKLLLVSTPTKRGGSRIEQRYQQTDQCHRHLPCPHCGAMQEFVWPNMHWTTRIVTAAPGAAERREVIDAWYECAHCGERVDEHQKPDILARGQWVPSVRDAPKNKRGFQWSSIINPIALGPRWTEMAQRWIDAQGDPGRLQVFINTYLGETWEDARRHRTDANDIAQRAEPYALRTAPADCLLVTVGVDVQDDRLSVQWVGWGAGRRWWALDWVEPPGNPTHDAVWDDLLALLLQPIPHAMGGTLRVRAVGVDIGGRHTAAVKAFVTRASALVAAPVMALQGSRHRAPSILPRRPMHTEMRPDGKRARRGTPVWQVGTEIAKDQLYNDLAADAELPPDERRAHFAADLPPEYYAQLTSETFNPVRNRYELRRGRRNEGLDTWVYACAAAHHPLLRVDKMTDRHWQDLARMVAPPAPGQPTPPAVTGAPRPAPAKGGAPAARGFASDDWVSRL